MSMDMPYSFTQQGDDFRFDTDNGIFYSVNFTDGSFYFFDLPPHIPVYEMSIKVVSFGNHLSPPHDKRVEVTIVEIFRFFLSDNENSIVYVCDNLDDKQAARHRKFDMWFKRYSGKDLEKYDTHFLVETTEIYASLILHCSNPFKEELIKVFLSQVDEYDKDE